MVGVQVSQKASSSQLASLNNDILNPALGIPPELVAVRTWDQLAGPPVAAGAAGAANNKDGGGGTEEEREQTATWMRRVFKASDVYKLNL